MASFFFGAGCKSEWSTDKEGHWNVNDDFNSDNGIVAMKAMHDFENSPMFLAKSSAAELDAGAAVVVSGTWDSGTASDILKDNLGVAPLPSYTVDGKDYQLVSFMGYKLMGVKPQTDSVKAAALHKLAQYLTSEAGQVERHAAVGWGPSNLKAQAAEAVQNDPVLAAVVKQAKNSVVQGQVNDGWWNLAAALAQTAKDESSEDAYKKALETYAEGLEKLKNLREGLLFVGAWNEWNNADDADTYVLTGDGDVKTLTLEVPQSDYMGGRIVNIGSWENDKGFAQVKTGADLLNAEAAGDDNNIVFKEAGTYTISINTANNEISITK
jgi:arabinogalactan oligomer/maltooligosaccharide transport system substrate-binding protein